MSARARQSGMTLIEVLVAILIAAVGVLGIAALQMRAYAANMEAHQRASAVILLQDMVNRINANRAAAADYVASDIGAGNVQNCAAAADIATRDLCEWGNLLRGTAETNSSGTQIGAMQRARGCITTAVPLTAAPTAAALIVAVVWEGVTPTAAPTTACGAGTYSPDTLRRAVTSIVEIGSLT